MPSLCLRLDQTQTQERSKLCLGQSWKGNKKEKGLEETQEICGDCTQHAISSKEMFFFFEAPFEVASVMTLEAKTSSFMQTKAQFGM